MKKSDAQRAQDWRTVFDFLMTNGATKNEHAVGTAETKRRLRMPNPDFEGMWKRGFIEWFQPLGSRLWHCYAAVSQLPPDPVAAPKIRTYD